MDKEWVGRDRWQMQKTIGYEPAEHGMSEQGVYFDEAQAQREREDEAARQEAERKEAVRLAREREEEEARARTEERIQRSNAMSGVCMAYGGTVDGEQECQLPYTYAGQSYDSCQQYGDRFWCATTQNYDQDKQWGYCDCDTPNDDLQVRDCPTNAGTANGQKCHFPFIYMGKALNNCLAYGTKFWCATTADYADGQWGYCDESCWPFRFP